MRMYNRPLDRQEDLSEPRKQRGVSKVSYTLVSEEIDEHIEVETHFASVVKTTRFSIVTAFRSDW